MLLESALLLGLALICAALIYVLILLLSMQQTIDRAAARFALWTSPQQAEPEPVQKPKRKPGRKPKPAPAVEPAQTPELVVGLDIDPRQLTIKP
jgi:hypothetical protein